MTENQSQKQTAHKPAPDGVAAPGQAPSREQLAKDPPAKNPPAKEFGGPSGPEPTRYGDWERNGRASDF